MGTDETTAATPVGAFLAGVGASFFLKLTTSVDDLVWFSPFLALAHSTPQRLKYCSVYVCVCVLVAATALCLAQAAELGFALAASAIASGEEGGDAARDGVGGAAPEAFWDASRVLKMCASTIIFIYAVVELRGWISEGNELPSIRRVCRGARTGRCCLSRTEGAHLSEQGEDQDIHIEFKAIDDSNPMKYQAEEAESVGKVCISAAEITNATAESPMTNEEVLFDEVRPSSIDGTADGSDSGTADDEDEDVQAKIRTASRSIYALFAVALCGTIDDMILFAAVVAGRGIPWTSVLPGSLLAALVVLAVCWHISLYEPFANFVTRVPMWVLLGVISLYLFIGVFL